MWGYQEHFRVALNHLVDNVLAALGAEVKAEVLLVGVRKPGGRREHPVCISPEDGKWPLELFDNLLPAIEKAYSEHELHNMFFGDERAMDEKPEWARRSSVQTCIQEFLNAYDRLSDVTSFCGEPRRVDDYYVSPVIQLPNKVFEQFPLLPIWKKRNEYDRSGHRSLIHAAMSVLLREATEELERPEPGRDINGQMRSDEEIVRIAARNFMWTAGSSTSVRHYENDLFDVLNMVSSLMYEGAKGIGELVLIDAEKDIATFIAKFAEPVPLRKPRWVRKVLQMANEGISIIADCDNIYGLGNLQTEAVANERCGFVVQFIDHYHWELRFRDQILLRSHYSVPRLPQEPFNKITFIANYSRMFPQSSELDALHLWSLMKIQMQQRHGSMIVVAEDAAAEASRLSGQGTPIEPVRLTGALLRSASTIDGTILVDPFGNCHAIGVILDGDASDMCTPSRGSRYNSGVRYVKAGLNRRLAIVASDDRTVDLIPTLRPLISGKLIERYINLLEAATRENYLEPRNWLDSNRFYTNQQQCNRINAALDRLDALPHTGIYVLTNRFKPHPEMDESYITEDINDAPS